MTTRTFCTLLLACIVLMPGAPAADAVPNAAQIFLYQGNDRDQRLLEGARKEGSVVIYTSLNLKDSVPLTEVFEKKYGIKTVLWRASSEKVVQRSVTEARAGRFAADVYETNGPEMEILHREKLLDNFYSPWFADIPPQAFPKHRQWVPVLEQQSGDERNRVQEWWRGNHASRLASSARA